jgi:hypothetical protein
MLQMESPPASPCQRAENVVEMVDALPDPLELLEPDDVQTLFSTCDPILVARFLRFMEVLAQVDSAAWEELKASVSRAPVSSWQPRSARVCRAAETRTLKPLDARRFTFNRLSILTAWCGWMCPSPGSSAPLSSYEPLVTFGLLWGRQSMLHRAPVHLLGDMVRHSWTV